MSKLDRADNRELASELADLCRSVKRVEQLLGERTRTVSNEGQSIALETSSRYLRNAVRQLDLARNSFASVNWKDN